MSPKGQRARSQQGPAPSYSGRAGVMTETGSAGSPAIVSRAMSGALRSTASKSGQQKPKPSSQLRRGS